MSGFAIYGTGGFAREVLGTLRRMMDQGDGKGAGRVSDQHQIVFIDDAPDAMGRQIKDIRVISYDEARAQGRDISIAIADGTTRRRLADKVLADGLSVFQIVADSVVRHDGVELGEGAILCDHVTLTGDATIGVHFHANIYSYVAHDCVIGDFVTFAPRVNCNGNVTIGDDAYIGTGAIIRQGLTIGSGAVIGMGAVVTKDVAPGVTVVGNPAHVLGR